MLRKTVAPFHRRVNEEAKLLWPNSTERASARAGSGMRPKILRYNQTCMGSVAEHEGAAAANQAIRLELHALTRSCGMFRPNSALFAVSGKDRVRWLNGMVSNNIRDLAPGHGVYAFVLSAQGQIQGDLYAFNHGERITLEVDREQAGPLLTLLRRYIIMDKVEIEALESTVVVVLAGPESLKVLAGIGLEVPPLGPLEMIDRSWKDTTLAILRGDNPQVENYELWAPAGEAATLSDALKNAGAMEVQGPAVEMLRILCGIPKVGQDIRERTLPQETGQDRALSFTKGCYIGQEIVERIRARGSVHRLLTGFEVIGAAPKPGAKIQSEGKDVGEITSVAPSLGNADEMLALGYLRRESMSADKDFSIEGARVKIRPLPFAELDSL